MYNCITPVNGRKVFLGWNNPGYKSYFTRYNSFWAPLCMVFFPVLAPIIFILELAGGSQIAEAKKCFTKKIWKENTYRTSLNNAKEQENELGVSFLNSGTPHFTPQNDDHFYVGKAMVAGETQPLRKPPSRITHLSICQTFEKVHISPSKTKTHWSPWKAELETPNLFGSKSTIKEMAPTPKWPLFSLGFQNKKYTLRGDVLDPLKAIEKEVWNADPNNYSQDIWKTRLVQWFIGCFQK